ncbi:hypothetical protein [Martelella sp. HB161492]|uniref:phage baseplate assembly protein n=1 Tax=Martelella sp. HB161492 TaxID=2720726 RepID=UPI0015906938|nr:hypothetical protein [Martelella sp. HB161492]
MFETVRLEGLDLDIKTFEFESSAEEAVSQVRISCKPPGDGLDLEPGTAVKVYAGSDLLLTGYLRDIVPGHDKDNRTLDITIVSRTVDATECSVEHESGEVIGKTIDAVAREFDTLDIGIVADEEFPTEAKVKLEIGETMFAAIERVARGRGILIYDTPEGKLKLTTKQEGTLSGGCLWGVNIERADATLTEQGRYSPVIVRGQTTEAGDITAERKQATATDDTVNRRRPLILKFDGNAGTESAKERAVWTVQRNAAKALEVHLTVTGWRDNAGQLFRRNWMILVQDKWLGVDGKLVIKRAILRQDGASDGTVALLTLCDPRALGGENPRGKTSKAYKAKAKGKSKSVDWAEFVEKRSQGEW